jgi:hypothetical protein
MATERLRVPHDPKAIATRTAALLLGIVMIAMMFYFLIRAS